MPQLNERFIKVGKLPVSIAMLLENHIQLKVIGEEEFYNLECVKIEHKSNNDGTYDEVYVLKHTL